MSDEQRARLNVLTGVVAIILVIAVASGGAFSALVRYDLVGLGHLPRVAVFCVVLLIIVNAVCSALGRKRPFSGGQLAFIYVAILVMAGLPGQQLVTYLYLGMIGSQYYAAPENTFAENVLPYIKPWMVPSLDGESPVISYAFHGVPDFEPYPYLPWIKPLLAWTPYLLAIFGVQLFLGALLRRRWDDERLTYPLSQVPVEVTRYSSPQEIVPSVFRDRWFWLMFAIPVIVHTKNALSHYYPFIGPINLNKNIGRIFEGGPWANFNYLPYMVYFETMGTAYLIPVDTGFSLWFFWIFRRFVLVFRDARGLTDHPQFFTQQGIGAYLFLAVLCVWAARRRIAEMFRAAVARRAEDDPERQPVSPRMAVFGLFLSAAVFVGWGVCAGANVPMALAMLALYCAAIITLSRLVAESGLFAVWTPIGGPQDFVVRAWPENALNPQAITAVCYMGWKIQDSASCTMANILQGYKMAELGQLRARTVFWLMVAALVVGLFSSHLPSLYAIYSYSVPNLGWWPRNAADNLPLQIDTLVARRTPFDRGMYANMLSGAAIAGMLWLLRLHILRWPFQPLAYAATLGPQFMMDRYGFSIFVGWLVKYVLLRLGGIKAYLRFRPAAFGIIVGNAMVLLFWTIYHYFVPIEGVLVIE